MWLVEATVVKMFLYQVAQGARLALALMKEMGKKEVRVFFGLYEHAEGWLNESNQEQLQEKDLPWIRKIVCEQDILDFCNYADELAEVMLDLCTGRTFWFEGFTCEKCEDATIFKIQWGS